MIALEKKTLPLLILRDVIIFPGTIAPIFIGREKSLNALLAAKRIDDGQHILLTTQKKQDIEEPGSHDLFRIGVLAKIIQTVKLPNNNATTVLLDENDKEIKIKAKEGDLVTFPAYILHKSNVIEDNTRKTVIAFNCCYY